MRVLIVEDDLDLAEAISDYLELHHIHCDFAYSGESALQMVTQQVFDLIILDVMLPTLNGFQVSQQLRKLDYTTPILMLTACDTEQDQIKGFRSGVDDYVTKPCSMPLLLARLKAIHRRHCPPASQLIIGSLELNIPSQTVTRENLPIPLSPTSWKILELLARHSPNVVSRQAIESHIWPNQVVDERNLHVQLHLLRKVIDKPFATPLIHTIKGQGICIHNASN